MKNTKSFAESVAKTIERMSLDPINATVESTCNGWDIILTTADDEDIKLVSEMDTMHLYQEYEELADDFEQYIEDNDLDDVSDAKQIANRFEEAEISYGQAVLPYAEEYVARKLMED